MFNNGKTTICLTRPSSNARISSLMQTHVQQKIMRRGKRKKQQKAYSAVSAWFNTETWVMYRCILIQDGASPKDVWVDKEGQAHHKLNANTNYKQIQWYQIHVCNPWKSSTMTWKTRYQDIQINNVIGREIKHMIHHTWHMEVASHNGAGGAAHLSLWYT